MKRSVYDVRAHDGAACRGPTRPWFAALLVAASLFLFPGSLSAEEGTSDAALDVLLLLDGSGSMRVTDPHGLRNQGASLFTRFLGADDRFGVIGFSDSATTVRALAAGPPGPSPSGETPFDAIGLSGRYTDLEAGLRAAAETLRATARPGVVKLVVMLSDGKMEPDPAVRPAAEAVARLTDEVLPALRSAGVVVHTLAFSESADKELLTRIAAETGGLSWYTPDAETVHKSFAELFLAVKKPQMVPLTKKGFSVDEEIEEATFYVNRDESGELTVVPPSGRQFTAADKPENVKWFRGDKFDVVTVPAPAHGQWQLSGALTADSFATVLTDLKLTAEWPQSVSVGDVNTIKASLQESGKPVVLPEMNGVIRYAYQILPTDRVSEPIRKDLLSDDGSGGDVVPKDGVFSASVELDVAGEYRLRVVARGPTFSREQSIPFRVRPRLVSLALGETEEPLAAGSGHEGEGHGGHGDARAAGHGAGPTDGHHAGDHGGAASSDARPSEADDGHDTDGHGIGIGGHGKGGHGEHGDGEHGDGEHGDGHGRHDAGARAVFVVTLAPDTTAFKRADVTLVAVDRSKAKFVVPLVRSHKEPLKYFAPVDLLTRPGTYEVRAHFEGAGKRGPATRAQSNTLPFDVERHEEEAPEPDAPEVKVELPPDTTPSAWPLYLASLVLNGAIVFGGVKAAGRFMPAVRAAGGGPADRPGEAAAAALIESLEAALAKPEPDLSDPRYAERRPQRPASRPDPEPAAAAPEGHPGPDDPGSPPSEEGAE